MRNRADLLISCTTMEAAQMRLHAKAQQRTLSATVLRVVLRGIDVDDQLYDRYHKLGPVRARAIKRDPRTAIHLRCSAQDSKRIRDAARRRGTTISALILYFLRASWVAEADVRRNIDDAVKARQPWGEPNG
jgi:hypothetical protein